MTCVQIARLPLCKYELAGMGNTDYRATHLQMAPPKAMTITKKAAAQPITGDKVLLDCLA